jgi:nitroreductase
VPLLPDPEADSFRSRRAHGARAPAYPSPPIGKSRVRFEYVSAPLSVWPTVNATEFLVAIAPKQYDRLAIIDVDRSFQKIVIDATRMGLGTCWIGPGADQTSVARHLGARFDVEKDHTVYVYAVGYASGYIPMFLRLFNLQFRRRLPLSRLFFADPRFQKPLNVQEDPFRQFGPTYEVCEWSPSCHNGQTTRCVGVQDMLFANPGESREPQPGRVRFDFYADTASRYYAPVALGIWVADWEMGCKALGIKGRVAVLSAEQRGERLGQTTHRLPKYDVSWISD